MGAIRPSAWAVPTLAMTLVAVPAQAATASIIYGPALGHPMSLVMLLGLVTTAISLIARRTRLRPRVEWLGLPLASFNLLGLTLLGMVILRGLETSSRPTEAAALAISLTIVLTITTIWLLVAHNQEKSPWFSLQMVSALVGCVLLMTPVEIGVTCGTACFGRPQPF